MPRFTIVLLCLALLIAKAHAGTYCIRASTTANGKESLPTNFVTREVTAPATAFKISWVNPPTYDDNSPLPASEITQTRVAWGTCAGDVFTKMGEQKIPGAPTSTILSLDDPTPPPPPTCGASPAPESRQQTCTAPSIGQWSQSRTYTSADPPACWTAGPWVPSEAAAGVCVTPPPPPLKTSSALTFQLRTVAGAQSMLAVGLVPVGLPCGPQTQIVSGVKYCRVPLWRPDGSLQIAMPGWPTVLSETDFWARTQ